MPEGFTVGVGQYTQDTCVYRAPIVPAVCAMGYQPDRCLVVVCVGWLALRLSACASGSAVAGLHFRNTARWGAPPQAAGVVHAGGPAREDNAVAGQCEKQRLIRAPI